MIGLVGFGFLFLLGRSEVHGGQLGGAVVELNYIRKLLHCEDGSGDIKGESKHSNVSIKNIKHGSLSKSQQVTADEPELVTAAKY